MSGRTRVRIVGDHPHRGSSGTVRDDLPRVQGMWKIQLDDAPGVDACYAGPENLRALILDADPRPDTNTGSGT